MPESHNTPEDISTQIAFLNFMISNGTLYTRVQNIFNYENFDKSLRKPAKFLAEYTEQHGMVPSVIQMNLQSSKEFEDYGHVAEAHEDWFLEEFEKFTRKEELQRAIFKSADLLNKGDYDPVEKIVSDAVQISLTKDLGINYFENPKKRLTALRDDSGMVSTGWKDLDYKLFGGINRGGLHIFCGVPGMGKSLFLQNIALNWVENGLNGVYISFELDEKLVAQRMDTMLTGIGTKELMNRIDDVELKIAMAQKKYGKLKIKYMPPQSTVNQIKAYIKELQIQDGFLPDFICFDYLDLIMPSDHKVDMSDYFTKDKLVSESLRAYGQQMKCLMVTASQIGRAGFDEIEMSASSMAGGISKLNTADNVFAIYATRAMKERGQIQLQLLKTRNSSGVGSAVDLAYNPISLRVSDLPEEEKVEAMNGSSILERIKKSTPASQDPNAFPSTSSDSSLQSKRTTLNDLLNNIKKKQ